MTCWKGGTLKLKLLLNHLHNKRVLQNVQCVATVAVTSAILAGAQDVSNAHKQHNMASNAAACKLTNDSETNLEDKETTERTLISKNQACTRSSYESAEAECDPFMDESEFDTLVHIETTYSNLNVRQEPNSNSEIIGTLSNNQVVAFLDDTDGSSYVKVAVSGKVGYIHSKFISDEDLTEIGCIDSTEYPQAPVMTAPVGSQENSSNNAQNNTTEITSVAKSDEPSKSSCKSEEIADREEFYNHDEDEGFVSEDADNNQKYSDDTEDGDAEEVEIASASGEDINSSTSTSTSEATGSSEELMVLSEKESAALQETTAVSEEVPNQLTSTPEEISLESNDAATGSNLDSTESTSTSVEISTIPDTTTSTYTGPKLNSKKGTVHGPSGKETYYNLNMKGVVKKLKSMGIEGEYNVRADGVKCYGDKVLVAANLSVHPRGSIVETSLGTGIVADTGTFAASNATQIDIATAW